MAVEACGVECLDVGVERLAHFQQVIYVLIHQAISAQHLTDLQSTHSSTD
jgi:hypothetical protein